MTTDVTRVNRETGEVLTGAVAYDPTAYLRGLDTQMQQQLAAAYDAACKALIGPNDVQRADGRTFKKKSAWRKLARHFGLSTTVTASTSAYLTAPEGTTLFLATVTVRALAPWGQSAEAVGACGTDEATGRRTISLADALATAETRATNRAISNLIAMGEVSAEEIGDRAAQCAPAPRASAPPSRPAPAPTAPAKGTAAPAETRVPVCPKCGGGMWDNRAGKKNPKAPDFKCKDKGCDGVVWPPKATPVTVSHTMAAPAFDEMPPELDEPDNENRPF